MARVLVLQVRALGRRGGIVEGWGRRVAVDAEGASGGCLGMRYVVDGAGS